MFAYPKQAEFNRVVPKGKIYAHGKISKRVKELFVAQVGEIVWKYKLSPETINLPARSGIHEIQVFEIALKTPDLDLDVLRTMDGAIPFPLVFQLTHINQIRFATSYKRPSEADSTKWVIEALFVTGWQSFPASSSDLHPLPVSLDLAGLYEQIVRRHIPIQSRSGESLGEQVARFRTLEAKQKAQRQLESRLAQEKQFNRKVELNAALRALRSEVESLVS